MTDFTHVAAYALSVHKALGFSYCDECACGWPIPDEGGWADHAAHRAHQARAVLDAVAKPLRAEGWERAAEAYASPSDPNPYNPEETP